MWFLDRLGSVLGAALQPLMQNGVLHAATLSDTGTGGVTATTADAPVRLVVESLSAQDRIGLPRNAVRLTVLRTGLVRAIALDDGITVAGATYRITQIDTDPAGACFILVGVPA